MRAKPYTLLLHPLFVLCLGLLLLNDLYLKYAWHNAFTGKLSDFTGLFVFTVFLRTFFPNQQKTVIAFCVLFFCWWKSPLSDAAILFINTTLSLPVHRVVDYTDLFALPVILLAWLIKPPVYKTSVLQTIATYCIGFIAFYSFCASSVMRHLNYTPYREHEIEFEKRFKSRLSAEEVRQRLDPDGLGYTRDSMKYYKIQESGRFFHRVQQTDSLINWIPVTNTGDSTLFLRMETAPFFILPRYVLNGDTLSNMEIRIYDLPGKRKPTGFTIQTFQVKNQSAEKAFWDNNKARKYKKHFRKSLKR